MLDIIQQAAGLLVLSAMAAVATMVVSLTVIVVYICFSVVTGRWLN